MYTLRLAFRNAADDRLIVHAALNSTAVTPDQAAHTIYDDEDSFLRRLIAADLDFDMTRDLVVAVIRAIATPSRFGDWVDAKLSEEQSRVLGLNLTPATSLLPALPHPFGGEAQGQQFHDFLMNSPTPFAMVSGPAYTITFLNDPYVRIVGRTSADQLLGLPILEALPELEGQPCLALLESAYQTGLSQRRTELKATVHEEDTGLDVERFFDIIYQPVCDAQGRVQSIMAQATDVTERVLSRQVTEHREDKLYRLWAELDTLYRALPVGIGVIDARSLNLLRLNARLAEQLGSTSDDLMGVNLPETYPQMYALLLKASHGTTLRGPIRASSTCCHFTFIPTLDTQGVVETITLIAESAPQAASFADEEDLIFSLA